MLDSAHPATNTIDLDRSSARMSASESAPGNQFAARDNRVIWLLLGAAFVVILNETIMGVAIPHLMDDLHITAVAAQWLTTGFMLTMAVVIPITGFLLQRFNTRSIFITAMSLFSLGTLTAAMAPGFEVLLVARVIQASGTAIMMPLLMTTIMTLVAPQARGRMMGRVSIVMSLAPAIGPSLSGLILSTLNWRWMFIVVLPIAVAMLLIGMKWMLNVSEPRPARVDLLSVLLSAFGFGGLVYGLSQIGSGGHGTSPADLAAQNMATASMWISLAVGALSLTIFILRQIALQRSDRALLDLRVFRSLNFSLAMAQMTVLTAAFFGSIILTPLYLQHVLGLTALESGLIVLPGALMMGLLGPVVGRIYDARGPRVLLVPGAIISSASLWTFTTVTETTSPFLIMGLQVVLSLGLALSFTPLFTASLGSLEPRFYSHGSAIVGTVQQVAGAAGIALFVTLMSSLATSELAAGASNAAAQATGVRGAYTIGAALSLLTIIGAFLVRKPADDIVDTDR